MPLDRFQRKARLPFGAAGTVARELGCSKAYVSEVLNDRSVGDSPLARKVRVALARKMKVRVAEAFPPVSMQQVA